MTVGELIGLLRKYPGESEVVVQKVQGEGTVKKDSVGYQGENKAIVTVGQAMSEALVILGVEP